jgi:hypothetical protein
MGICNINDNYSYGGKLGIGPLEGDLGAASAGETPVMYHSRTEDT